MDHNDGLVADEIEPRSASGRASTQWPRGVVLALGAAGAFGMVLITVSGVAVGPTGPTGSSVERAILAIVPKGTAATVLGAVTMTLGLILVLGAWIVLGLLLRRGAAVKPLYKWRACGARRCSSARRSSVATSTATRPTA